MNETNQVDRKDLKIQALVEKISNLVAAYENQVADLRVELTLSDHSVQNLRAKLAASQADLEALQLEKEKDAKPAKKAAKSRSTN